VMRTVWFWIASRASLPCLLGGPTTSRADLVKIAIAVVLSSASVASCTVYVNLYKVLGNRDFRFMIFPRIPY
jgi:hypothetical protein